MNNKTLIYNVYQIDGKYTAALADSDRDTMARNLEAWFKGSVSVDVSNMFPGTPEDWDRFLQSVAIDRFETIESGDPS